MKKNKPIVTKEIFMRKLMENIIHFKNTAVYDFELEADVFIIFKRFQDSLDEDTFSAKCPPIKKTCRDLKTENTRENINEILKRGEI